MPSLEIRLRKHNDTNILKTYTDVKNKKILKDLTCSKIQKENKKEKNNKTKQNEKSPTILAHPMAGCDACS